MTLDEESQPANTETSVHTRLDRHCTYLRLLQVLLGLPVEGPDRDGHGSAEDLQGHESLDAYSERHDEMTLNLFVFTRTKKMVAEVRQCAPTSSEEMPIPTT